MKKNRLGIIGATGYVGMELVRLAVLHGQLDLTVLVSQSYVGRRFSDIYPAFRGLVDLELSELSVDELTEKCDLIVTALPHGVSAKIVPQLLERGLKVLDHSGDFRYRNANIYEEAYKLTHPNPELLEQAVYGLPEIYRNQLKYTQLAANPGCYPTCSILGLLPLLRGGLIQTEGIIIDAYSGISGAGRKADLSFSFCEAQDSIKPYGVVGHRHTSEIEQETGLLVGSAKPLTISFTPHLAPFKRGMLATIYARLQDNTTVEQIEQAYTDAYAKEKFIRMLPTGQMPETRNVAYTNFADIAWAVDQRTGLVKIMSAIDNLGKGASGQALQSINIMLGLPEETGLLAAGGAI
jgi:N-acetyl-gamma-glutamyl-phosphate reductase